MRYKEIIEASLKDCIKYRQQAVENYKDSLYFMRELNGTEYRQSYFTAAFLAEFNRMSVIHWNEKIESYKNELKTRY